MIAHDYAKALCQLKPTPSVSRLKALLRARGHEKLLPQIFREYQKLLLQESRIELHEKVTPKKEQTRVLLELYRKLTHV